MKLDGWAFLALDLKTWFVASVSHYEPLFPEGDVWTAVGKTSLWLLKVG